jgi:hypothetical protein
MRALASVFAYIFSGGVLNPVCVPISRDETGTLVANFATISSNRKGTTIAGNLVAEHDVTDRVMYTFLAVSRAARKSTTPVVLGRSVVINPRSRMGVEMARLTSTTTAGIVLADWRTAQHDAEKEGYTLQELNAALNAAYAQ